jgi:hypothetical protein
LNLARRDLSLLEYIAPIGRVQWTEDLKFKIIKYFFRLLFSHGQCLGSVIFDDPREDKVLVEVIRGESAKRVDHHQVLQSVSRKM